MSSSSDPRARFPSTRMRCRRQERPAAEWAIWSGASDAPRQFGCTRRSETHAGQRLARECYINTSKLGIFASPGEHGMTPLKYHWNRRLSAAIFTFAATFLAIPLRAQGTGRISGTATDSAGAPIYSAQVSFSGVEQPVFTDEGGAFFLSHVPVGTGTLTARRLGFAPLSVSVTVADANADVKDVALKLARLPIFLEAVLVETQRVNYTGRLAGYYQRLEKRNGGYFITRDQINRENPRTLAQLLQHVPAISGTRMRGGGSGVRMRGRTCAPLVWLDATPMPAGELDLNAISPQTIQGIELYPGIDYRSGALRSQSRYEQLWDDHPLVARPRYRSDEIEQAVSRSRAARCIPHRVHRRSGR